MRAPRPPLWGAAALFAFVGLFALVPAGAEAQYFGRNKVQYEEFDWKVMHTDHFEVHFYPEEREAATDGARMAERWQARLEQVFQHKLSERKPIVYYADHPDFQQTNVVSGLIGEGTGGVTEALKNRLTLPFTGVYADNDHVIGHEMVHVFQYDIAGGEGGGMSGISTMSRLPLWLVEGMAEYLSQGRLDTHTAMWMRDAALRNDLPTIKQITRDPRYFPYRYGEALLAYVGGLYGDGAVTALFRNSLRTGWEGAVRAVLGMTSDSLSKQWITATRNAYLPAMESRTAPKEVGERILAKDLDAGEMNVSPSVSPDGRYVAFLTEKDLFNIDYYIADAHTGKVLKKIASSDSDPHFDALSFLQSSGTWSPDGREFAFVVFAEGDNELAIVNVESGDVTRRIQVRGVGAMKDPAWSPDGRTIAFSGMSGGISDLYLLDVSTGTVRQLTNDRFADIQPAWSPDGARIAFATDRGPQTDFARLTFGPMHLATYDVGTGAIDVLPALDEQAKHINPQYSPDGGSLYFISDRDGFSDVYRLDLASGQFYQVTNVKTGVSGITALSPALSVASRNGRVMFSIFGDSEYTVHALEPNVAQGSPVGPAPTGVQPARVLPPVDSYGRGLVYDYMHDDLTGLPAATEFTVSDYAPHLSLDYVGAPTIGAGYDPTFGAAFGGAVSFLFSDMLGNRQLGVAVQAQGSQKDIGGQAVYLNTKNRWNWGVALSHTPYLSGYSQAFYDPSSGERLDLLVREHFYVSQAEGLLEYPFSQTRRFEVTGGYTRYAYNLEVDSIISFNGRIIDRRNVSLDNQAPPDVHLFSVSPALVGDNTNFAFVGPVSGWRYRYEVTPTAGTLNFASVLGDYRRYFFFNPLTLAFRAMHYGYYFGDENDPRLRDGLFLGYESLIRGYSFSSFDNAAECSTTSTTGTGCPALNRLFGSRIAVFNAELRVPVLGVEQFGLINFPYLPMEFAAFFDGGLAWCGGSNAAFNAAQPPACGPDANGNGGEDLKLAWTNGRTTDRVPVFSAGVTTRWNILGYLILEVYYAYPFQRPDKGAHFGFNISPGW